MVYTLSYQMYKCEHGLAAAEQRAADVRAGEAAAALRDLRLRLGRTFRPRHRVRPAPGATDAMTALARVRPPFSVNAMALAAIEAAAAAPAWRAMTVARVQEERARLEAELTRLDVEHFPSQANFVTARLDPQLVAPALAGCGLVVRSGDDLGLPGWVRISVGWAPQMAQLRALLRTLVRAR